MPAREGLQQTAATRLALESADDAPRATRRRQQLSADGEQTNVLPYNASRKICVDRCTPVQAMYSTYMYMRTYVKTDKKTHMGLKIYKLIVQYSYFNG